MEFGICIPHYGKVIDVGKIIENVQYAESMGFDSVWVTDHIIVPIVVNAFAPPMPSLKRCVHVGAFVREAIERWPEQKRVAVIGTEVLSH